MPDTISRSERRLRRRVDELWSRLQATCLQIPLRHGARLTSPNWEVFSERFDRCFRRVSLYVGRCVNDRESLERIVRAVLGENLELFIEPCDAQEEMRRLKASADRLLVLGPLIDSGADAHYATSTDAWLDPRREETTHH